MKTLQAVKNKVLTCSVNCISCNMLHGQQDRFFKNKNGNENERRLSSATCMQYLIEIPIIQHNDKYQQENYFEANKQNDSFNNFAAFRYINTKRPSLDDVTYVRFH